ncbi:MAG: tripartite tricarboxylate transporter permease, partial [Candidatus Micrarchaeia archaeon]
MIGFLFFCFFGILVGFFAGLLPGVHPNQIYFLIISLGLFVETKTLIVFLASLATANIIFNYIPTLFLSLPHTNTVLNLLPGHKLVLKGKGLKALKINLISFLLAALLIFATSPLLFLITEKLQKFAKPFIPYFLGTLVIVTILVEKGERKVFALLLFLLSGVLGLVTLNGKGLKQDVAIFCILTGLFGIPNLLFVQKESIPKQDTSEDDVKLDVKLILL